MIKYILYFVVKHMSKEDEGKRYSELRNRLKERLEVYKIPITPGILNSNLDGSNSYSYAATFDEVTKKAKGKRLKEVVEELILQRKIIYCADFAGSGSPFIDYPNNIQGVSVSLELEDFGLPKFTSWKDDDYQQIQHIIGAIEDPTTWHALKSWVKERGAFDLVFYKPVGDPIETFRNTDKMNYVESVIDAQTDAITYYLNTYKHYLKKIWPLMRQNSYLFADLNHYLPYPSSDQILQVTQTLNPPAFITISSPFTVLAVKR